MKKLKIYLSEYHVSEEVEIIDRFGDSHYMTAGEAIAEYGDELVEREAGDTKTWWLA